MLYDHGCWFCRLKPKCPCGSADDKPKKKFILPKDEDILQIKYVSGLGYAATNINHKRDSFVGWMTDHLYDERNAFYHSDGKTPFPILLCTVYKSFNDDGSFRWLAELDKFAFKSPMQKPPQKILLRLQLISLAIMAARPDLANNFLDPNLVPPLKGAA
jgi:hypothetical protein